ncbi:2,4-dienoyl-CoA reductase-like NADH-dependent reductase (Old Yellow Enzyme family)/thioredoxin reductase [Roseovarius sp. MBR-51]
MSLPRRNDPLLTPFSLSKLTLRNRIISTSHASMFDDGGMPTERYQAYHEEKARGGIAMTMIGGSAMVSRDSSWGGGQLDMSSDRIIPHLQRLSERIHAHGSAVMTQISHLGRRANALHGDWHPAIAPSRIREIRGRSIPREMDRNDIDRVIADYASAARRALEGGLDGIETLCGGHLIGQFMSPLTNHRTDSFGGSLENRARFGLMVHEALRKAVDDRLVIGIRLVIDEGVAGGLTAADGMALAQMFEREGQVDFFNAIYGRMDSDLVLSEDNMPGLFQPSAPYLESVRTFRAETTLPLIHAGGIRDTATARHVIAEGIADLVGMTRAHIADPHIVRRIEAGEEDRIRPCVGSSYCLYKKATCVHNAATGNELSIAHDVSLADTKRRVVVVGGGIAGLEAARVAALRGHHVTLFEAASQLGGQMLLATRAPYRTPLIGIIDWRVQELDRLGVRIQTDTLATCDDVLALSPDAVLIATGGIPDLEWLPGAVHCVSTWDILSGAVPLGFDILIYDGTGRQPAPSSALATAGMGRKTTLVTRDSHVGQEMPYQDSTGFRKNLGLQGVHCLTDLELIDVTQSGNRLHARFVHTFTGEHHCRDVDQVVIEAGTTPVLDLHDDLRASLNQPKSAMMEGGVHLIGDAVASRDIHAAIREAHLAARIL